MYGYIYKTTNLINGKQYIGQHKSDNFEFDKYMGSGMRLWEAIRKYGKENFKVTLLESINNVPTICETKEELNFSEKYYISYYNCVKDPSFYNCAEGGQDGFFRGCHHSEENRKIISECSSDRIWIHKDDKNKFIKPNQLENFLTLGWVKGRISDKSYAKDAKRSKAISDNKKGKNYYTDGNIVKMLSLEEYESVYKPLGYRPGSRRSNGEIIYRDLFVTNGSEVRSTNSSRIKGYLNRGWSEYPCDKTEAEEKFKAYNIVKKEKQYHNQSEITKRCWQNSTPEKREERIKKIRAARAKQVNVNCHGTLGKMWVYNPTENVRKAIYKEELEEYLSSGWIKGISPQHSQRLKECSSNRIVTKETRKKLSDSHKGQQKNNKWINNGEINKRIDRSLVEEYLENGWVLGKINYGK